MSANRSLNGSTGNRRAAAVLLPALAILAVLAACQPPVLHPPAELSFQPVRFDFPQADPVKLSNGMVLYLREDHELPLLTLVALIRTGAVYEPEDKLGLASLTGTVMRIGGTRSRSGDEINETLEFIAATMETGISREAGIASLSVLSKDREVGLDIFADVLMHPVFAQDKVDLAKQKELEAIRRRNDDPQGIAFREFRKTLFRGNPRGRVPTLKTVAAITREDMIAFHRNYVHPDAIILGVSGDFRRDEMIRTIEGLFAEWKPAGADVPPIPPGDAPAATCIQYAYKDLPQSTIVMGHPIIGKAHPDFFAFEVLNFILGDGGFRSRLMSEVRSNRGLAYSVGSIYNAEADHGLFAAYCFTKTDSTLESIRLISDIIRSVKEKGISQAELEWAKSSIVNNFVFAFTSPAQIVRAQVGIAYDKLPQEFLQTYRDSVMSITVDDVNRVAAQHLQPERMVVMVVGNGNSFDGQLSTLGTVNQINLDETF
jgi:predicted Zn-dependent peptidase